MSVHIHQKQNNDNQSVSNAKTNAGNSVENGVDVKATNIFVPAGLQHTIDNSSHAAQFKNVQQMLDNSLQVQQTTQFQAMANDNNIPEAVSASMVNTVAQLAPDAVTGRLSEEEANSLDTFLANNGIDDPSLFTKDDWATIEQSYSSLVATNKRLIKASSAHKKRPLRAKIATDYNALVTSAREFQVQSRQNLWSVEEGPALSGGRLEIKIRQQNYRDESPTYTVHVSIIRHLFENYWVLANDGVTQTEELNTMAYCSGGDFSAAFLRYAQAIIAAMNARHHARHREVFNTIDLDYDAGGGLRFNSDRPNYNVHAFPVETEGSAVTLNRVEHHNLKLVLRSMSAAEDSRQRREGKAAWPPIAESDNVITILRATNSYHDTRRLMEE